MNAVAAGSMAEHGEILATGRPVDEMHLFTQTDGGGLNVARAFRIRSAAAL